jgi:alpha-beta hydrolase superfamily lysophospholipase
VVWIGIAAAALLVAAALAWLWLVWGASTRAMRPARSSPAPLPRDLRGEELVVESRTGVTLAGRFFPGTNGAAVVLTHGYGGNQDELLPLVRALLAAGLGACTYDLRGCGRSGGSVTFGALEQLDLRAVVDLVAERPEVEAGQIGAFGFSVGAATTIMAAARDERIRAVVADSAWATAHTWLRPTVREALLHPRAPFTTPSLKLAEQRGGFRLAELRPVDDVGRIAPRPLLLLHGTADDVVLPEDADALLAAAGDPKELRLVPGAAHTATIAPGGASSSPEIPRFFERALARKA